MLSDNIFTVSSLKDPRTNNNNKNTKIIDTVPRPSKTQQKPLESMPKEWLGTDNANVTTSISTTSLVAKPFNLLTLKVTDPTMTHDNTATGLKIFDSGFTTLQYYLPILTIPVF